MEQQDLCKTMQQISGIKQIGDSILRFVLESPETINLNDLAAKVGDLLLTDICIIIGIKDNTNKHHTVGYWQNAEHLSAAEDSLVSHLSHLSLSLVNHHKSDIIEQTKSNLFEVIDHLLKKAFPTEAWFGYIVRQQQQVNGVVLLLKPVMSVEQKSLARISDSMAIAISHIQLQQQTQTQANYQSLLKNISREISQSSHYQSLFDNSLAEICSTLQVDKGMILMLKYQNPLRAKQRQQESVKGTARINCYWQNKSLDLTTQEKISFNLSDSNLCQKAWYDAPAHLYSESGTMFPDFATPTTDLLNSEGSALLMMPLMGQKSSENDSAAVLGFLVLQYNKEHFWHEDELDLIHWVSVQLSTALVHHQTLTQVKSIVEERTSKLEWSLNVKEKLSTKMRQQIEQLQKLNILKDDFMSSMSHELKTPLTSMKMAIKMLRQSSISPEMREKYLDILEQEWNREYNLIKDLLTLQSMESGELTYTPEELDLNQKADNLVQIFTDKWQPEKGIELRANISDSNLKINTDIESLENILDELLLNAAKYSDENTVIELSIQSKTTFQGKSIVISVINQGVEITGEELPHIFDKFRRGQGVTERAVPGTGLGLALVKYLVDHLNGTIEVSNRPLDHELTTYVTTFKLELPQSELSIS